MRTHHDAARFAALQRSATFARLRYRSRRYLAAMSALFLGAVVVMVFLAGWKPESLALQVIGHVNLGLLLAAGLILLPAAVCAIHLCYTGRRLDPLASRIRERVREEFESERL